MEPIRAILLGAGSRGQFTYAEFTKNNPTLLKIVAVADTDPVRRKAVQEAHGIPDGYSFSSWEEALESKAPADAVIIALQDKMHVAPIIAGMKRGLHILCEKPIAPTLEECLKLETASRDYNKVFMIAHVLRYTNFFTTVKGLLDSGRIGKLIGIEHNENVGHVHMSHSFVRGNWRNKAQSSPMILAKSCHDMDILLWLAGTDCLSLSSYGSLNYFNAANAPAGAPKRCLDGCPHSESCPFNVQKIYLGKWTGWPVNVVSNDLSLEGRLAALKTSPYGRCVFRCDNDVVDHQSVSLRFANGVTASFIMTAFSMTTHRNIRLVGTDGEILGDMEDNNIEVRQFSSGSIERITVAHLESGHAGGDPNLIADFARLAQAGGNNGRTSILQSIQSHVMAFAAEESRLNGGSLVEIKGFRAAHRP
jgi:predicted dehydrogenase